MRAVEATSDRDVFHSMDFARNSSSLARRASRVAVLCALVLALGPSRAAAAVAPGARFTRRAWTTDQGLPDNSILAIAQTQDGYLWVGTRGGLARFDGVRFVVFDQRSQPTWASETINALHVSRNGDLWIGTLDGGLLRMRSGVFARVDLPSPTVRALHEARDGTLWIAMDRGLARLRPGGRAEAAPSMAATYVYAFHEDPDGSVWLGTSNGLYVHRDGKYLPIGQELGVPAIPVYAVSRGRDHVLWVGTDGEGLFRVAGPRAQRMGLREIPVWSLLEDRRGNIWAATDHGLLNVRASGFSPVSSEHGLSGRVLGLFEDREGSVWVGTRYGGLICLSIGRVTSIGYERAYPSMLSVLEDAKGRIWFATAGGGLGRFDHNGETMYGAREGVASRIVGPILEDRDGRLWFGPRLGDKLQWIENDRVSSLPLQGTPAVLHQSVDGAIWIGTTGDGLYRLDRGRLKQWTTDAGLPSRAVRAMTDDGEGGLWLGTPRGLVRFRDGPRRVYTTADGLPSDRVMALYREPGGPLWVGTTGGLARLQNGRFTGYGLDQGLCDPQILAIADDGVGNLWMSSSRGLCRVARRELEEVASGARVTVGATAFGRADGMESAQCNGGYQPSVWKGADGRLWFPTVKGLAVVDPTSTEGSNPVIPPVSIEGVQADGRAVSLASPAHLAAGTSRIEIEYTALSFVAPERVRFRYRLTGFDQQWMDAGGRRRISYTNLPPGNYIFEVVACNNAGVWNRRGQRWQFAVAPFFYQRGSFYAVMAVLFFGLGCLLQAWRMRDLRVRNTLLAERAELSQEIHDHISQIMTGVVLQLDAASQTLARGPVACQPYIERASHLARQGIEETRSILRGLRKGPRPPISSQAALDEALADSVAPLIEGTGVRLRARRKGEPFLLSADARSDIFHVGQEAVTNALRHGQPREIEIVVAFEARGVRVTVTDDGRGFEPGRVLGGADGGLGLRGMARRVANRGGTLKVESEPGRGATVAAFFPRPAPKEQV